MGRSSKSLKAVRSCALLAVALLAIAPSAASAKAPHPPVLPPTAHPFGQSYSAWAADWWQWALEQPAPTNPLLDPTGANCASGQDGKVWFLAGTLTGGSVTRTCTVPTGKALLFPVVNAFTCVDPGQPSPGVAALRAQVAYVRQTATGLSATIDGVDVPDVSAYYEESEVFSLELTAQNPLSAPPGTYAPCVDAGYYIAVHPLPPGEHIIHFSGTVVPPGMPSFHVDVTYDLTVARGKR